MCKAPTSEPSDRPKEIETKDAPPPATSPNGPPSTSPPFRKRRRRAKRDRDPVRRPSRNRRATRRQTSHAPNASDPHDIIVTLLPSLLALGVAAFAFLAYMGFRGRATVAGIDLGTTNSVICVQAPSKSVGEIICLEDPSGGSAIVPSVVSFSQPPAKGAIVGRAAKSRIESHPHSTVYHAKRIIGLPYSHPAVSNLQNEVSFQISSSDDGSDDPIFDIPHVGRFTPAQIGSRVLQHLLGIAAASQSVIATKITSAVVTIPAEFSTEQRVATVEAYKEAGVKVARIVEEPTAAALAYGLHKMEHVEYVLVYDFGGGTLDVSVLRIIEGFVDVLGSRGDGRLGGVDFDEGIVNWFLGERDVVGEVDRVLQSIGMSEEEVYEKCDHKEEIPLCTLGSVFGLSENLKIGLSDLNETDDAVVTQTCLAIDATTSATDDICQRFEKHRISLSKSQFLEISSDLFRRSSLPIRDVLQDLDLTPEDIDEVVMVGGTTRMPEIRELVKKELKKAVLNCEIDPDLTVAYGAASVID